MPHINLKLFPGRTEEMKKEAAEKMLKAAQEALGCSAEALSVSIEEIKPDEWNSKVAEVVPEDKIVLGKMYVHK